MMKGLDSQNNNSIPAISKGGLRIGDSRGNSDVKIPLEIKVPVRSSSTGDRPRCEVDDVENRYQQIKSKLGLRKGDVVISESIDKVQLYKLTTHMEDGKRSNNADRPLPKDNPNNTRLSSTTQTTGNACQLGEKTTQEESRTQGKHGTQGGVTNKLNVHESMVSRSLLQRSEGETFESCSLSNQDYPSQVVVASERITTDDLIIPRDSSHSGRTEHTSQADLPGQKESLMPANMRGQIGESIRGDSIMETLNTFDKTADGGILDNNIVNSAKSISEVTKVCSCNETDNAKGEANNATSPLNNADKPKSNGNVNTSLTTTRTDIGEEKSVRISNACPQPLIHVTLPDIRIEGCDSDTEEPVVESIKTLNRLPKLDDRELLNMRLDMHNPGKRRWTQFEMLKDYNACGDTSDSNSHRSSEDEDTIDELEGAYIAQRQSRKSSILAWMQKPQRSTVADDVETRESDLSRLKAMATRLNLQTKRPSIVAWKEEYIDHLNRKWSERFKAKSSWNDDDNGSDDKRTDCNDADHDNVLEESAERCDESQRIVTENSTATGRTRHASLDKFKTESCEDDENFNWFNQKRETIDKSLAWLKQELKSMKAQDQSLAHQLLSLRQDIQQYRLQKCYVQHKEILEEAIDQGTKDEYSDLCDSPPDQFCSTLKDIGVTRMNISRRRFSVF